MARPDVRIRIRRSVIRISISEARIRTVIRIAAKVNPTRATNLFYHSKKNLFPFPRNVTRLGNLFNSFIFCKM